MIIESLKKQASHLAKNENSNIIETSHVLYVLITKFDEPPAILERLGCDCEKLIKLVGEVVTERPERTSPIPEKEILPLGMHAQNIFRNSLQKTISLDQISELNLITETVRFITLFEDTHPLKVAFQESTKSIYDLLEELVHIEDGKGIKKKKKTISEQSNDYTTMTYTHNSIIGLHKELDELSEHIVGGTAKLVSVHGSKSVGKKTLLAALSEMHPELTFIELNTTLVLNHLWAKGYFEKSLANAIDKAKNTNAIVVIPEFDIVSECLKPAFDVEAIILNGVRNGVNIITLSQQSTRSRGLKKLNLDTIIKEVQIKENFSEKELQLIMSSMYTEYLGDAPDTESIKVMANHIHLNIKENKIFNFSEVLEDAEVIISHEDLSPDEYLGAVTKAFNKRLKVNIDLTEKQKNETLEEKINSGIFGQETPINIICEHTRIANLGLKINKNAPNGVFALLGPSGVGKTETTRMVAKNLGYEFVLFNMAEYKEKHLSSKILGSPPGYVGYGDTDGALYEKLGSGGRYVVVLDEIEKAHPSIHDIFLSIFDNGTVVTSSGKEIDFSECIFFLTSNCGADPSSSKRFGVSLDKNNLSNFKVDIEVFNREFSPEFRNRLTHVIEFNPLDKESVYKIAKKSAQVIKKFAFESHGLQVEITDPVYRFIADKYFDPRMGARPIERGVEADISKEITSVLLKNNNNPKKASKNIKFSLSDGKINVKDF